jgi:hypothetical protein
MGTSNELKSIDLVELGCDLVSKQPSSSTGRNGPGFHIFRITPDQITKRTLVRNLLGTGDDADLIQSADFWTQTSVNTQNGSINNSRKNKEVKNLTASLPDGCIAILLLALLIETIDLCDLTRLMVAADKGDAVGVSVIISIEPKSEFAKYLLGFQAHKESKGLQGEITTVNKVTKEYKVLLSCAGNFVGVGRMSSGTCS